MELLLLALVLALCLFLIPLGLPGTWIMVGAGLAFNLLVGGEPIGWVTLALTLGIAVVGEVLEFTVAGRYARKYGGSKRAEWGAILGSIVGAVVGVPVPIIGSVIGAFVGAFAGALLMEYTRGRDHGVATRAATGALIGRAVASAIKVGLGCVIAVWLLVAAWQ